jgi:lipopolysaccharide export system permease protein
LKTYTKFLVGIFLKSFLFVLMIILSLVFIINLLGELDFFKDIETTTFFTIYLALINSPSIIFEIFPFIFLISTQLFFIKLFDKNQIQIFKYTGLKNSKIFIIVSIVSIALSFFIITIFYNASSNLKSFYLELKSKYTTDGKYLAVINKNGLWIRDKIEDKILIINSSKIDENFLIDSFITEFDQNYNVVRNIKSKKINIKNYEWEIMDPEIFEENISSRKDIIKIKSNFDYKRIQSLFSNLNSLSILELIELKKNYNLLNYSTTEVNIQIQKIFSYPFYLLLMSFFSGLIMLNTKKFKSNTVKISIGLFLCVVIYYFNNLLYVMGLTEKIDSKLSIWIPIIFLTIITLMMSNKLNEK